LQPVVARTSDQDIVSVAMGQCVEVLSADQNAAFCGVAKEDIVSIATAERVRISITGDVIGARTSLGKVVSATGEYCVVARSAINYIAFVIIDGHKSRHPLKTCRLPWNNVCAELRYRSGIPGRPNDETASTSQEVVALAAAQDIRAESSVQDIVPFIAFQQVIAVAALECIVLRSTVEFVVACGRKNNVPAALSAQRLIAIVVRDVVVTSSTQRLGLETGNYYAVVTPKAEEAHERIQNGNRIVALSAYLIRPRKRGSANNLNA
jgi:hypothetical protein